MRSNRIAAVAAAAALALGGCGSDDEESGSGTCDFTAVDTRRTCLEQSGNPVDIATQRRACEENAGTWTAEACPVNAELLGCCSYDLGLAFRECFYVRADRPYDPQSLCTNSTFNGTPGVWTPPPG